MEGVVYHLSVFNVLYSTQLRASTGGVHSYPAIGHSYPVIGNICIQKEAGLSECFFGLDTV